MDAIEQVTQIAGCKPFVDFREWLATQPDAATAWLSCERADWMLWLAGCGGADRRALVLAACDCAETALRYVPEGEDRPRVAIETARRWARGEATASAAYKARSAAYNAAGAYTPDAATDYIPHVYSVGSGAVATEYAATYAASAAACAARTAFNAAHSDPGYHAARYTAAYAAACTGDWRTMCDLIRKRWPTLADALPHAEVV